jgi:predicted dehydrogenase
VLVVGAGVMGTLHARALSGIRQAELCGVVDRSEPVAHRSSAKLGVPAFADLDRAISHARPDAAIVATPDRYHREPTEIALEAGLAVLVEKPLATTVDDAEAMARLAFERGRRLMPGHILRFDGRYADAAERVAAGRIGRPLLASAAAWGRKDLGARVSSTTTPLWHFGIHHIDAVQWIAGGVVEAVAGAEHVEAAGASVFAATGRLSNGTRFQLATGWTLPRGHAGGARTSLEVHGDAGLLSVTWGNGGLTTADDGGSERVEDRIWPSLYGGTRGLLRRELEHFVDRVIDRAPFAVTADDAVEAVRGAAALEAATAVGSIG